MTGRPPPRTVAKLAIALIVAVGLISAGAFATLYGYAQRGERQSDRIAELTAGLDGYARQQTCYLSGLAEFLDVATDSALSPERRARVGRAIIAELRRRAAAPVDEAPTVCTPARGLP